jgi:hypothetical protein
MKKVVDVIILVVFWSIIFVPLYLLSRKAGMGATAFIAALYLFFLFISITYKYLWSFQTFNNNKNILKFFSIALISFLILLYLTYLIYNAHEAYKYLVAENKAGSQGIQYQADDMLGFKPSPNARDFQPDTTGDKISIAYNNNGFRIPLSDAVKVDESDKINLLFLGDSFTFGAGCYAEETFPFLTAKDSHLSYINAGISSYGLAHMVILAEKLIPKYKPDYVIIQYSPWLVSRATSMFAPIYYFHLPFPYFAEKNNRYVLEAPIYTINFKAMNAQQIKSSYQGKFIKFLFEKALLFYLHEVWHSLRTEFLLITGQQPRAATNLREVEKYAYNRIKTVAERNGATVIILNLGDIEYSKNSHGLFSGSNIYFAEADSYLNDFLKTSPSKDYCMEFCYWIDNGKELILVDSHPNPKAHRIIADSIIAEINRTRNKSR